MQISHGRGVSESQNRKQIEIQDHRTTPNSHVQALARAATAHGDSRGILVEIEI